MATPPFDLDITDPTDTGIGDAFPANERTFRDNVQSYLGTEHDINTGYHEFQLLSTAQITSLSTPPSGMLVYDTTLNQLKINVGNPTSPSWFVVSGQVQLTAPMNFYVDATSGNDSANGLTLGTAWRTLQRAYTVIQLGYNLGGQTVTVNMVAGTYAPLTSIGGIAGQATPESLVFLGDTGSPGSYIIQAIGANAITASTGASFLLKGIALEATGTGLNGCGIVVLGGGIVTIDAVEFGACQQSHIRVDTGQVIISEAGSLTYAVTGAAEHHWSAGFQGLINMTGSGITITGTPAFGTAFATASDLSLIACSGITFTGTATGVRYTVGTNSLIDTGTSAGNTDNSYLPGGSSGSSASQGYYN